MIDLPRTPPLPPGDRIESHRLFTAADMRDYAKEYGQACFDAGRASVNPPMPNQKKYYNGSLNDLMDSMGMKR